jgi:hypothetical protein
LGQVYLEENENIGFQSLGSDQVPRENVVIIALSFGNEMDIAPHLGS